LIGDAAHTINPLAGQGANLGFMDAAVLVDVLSQAYLEDQPLGSLKILAQYERKRRLANQAMMNVMDVFYHGFSNDHAPLRIARNLGLGLANQIGLAKKQVMRLAMGIAPMGLMGIGLSAELPRLAR
jgi:3-demethoxyubiquinol 3-hydroxylase